MALFTSKGNLCETGQVFYDCKGNLCSRGQAFYDFKGNLCGPGQAFYDFKGNLCSPGQGFYDSKGYFRSPGDGFYDARGEWVHAAEPISTDQGGLFAFILAIPILIITYLIFACASFISEHFYLVFSALMICTMTLAYNFSKREKKSNLNMIISSIGYLMSMLPPLFVIFLYSVPYIVMDGFKVGNVFEGLLSFAFTAGLASVVVAINWFHEKALIELATGCLFFYLVMGFLGKGVTKLNEIHPIINEVYHMEKSWIISFMMRLV